MQVLYLGRIGLWRCWFFCGGRKTGNPEKNPQSKARTNNKLNLHVALGRNQSRAILVRGERSHHCAIPVLYCAIPPLYCAIPALYCAIPARYCAIPALYCATLLCIIISRRISFLATCSNY